METQTGPTRIAAPIMKFFECEHLPPKLRAVSEPICNLARLFDETLPDGAEKSAGLRKLLGSQRLLSPGFPMNHIKLAEGDACPKCQGTLLRKPDMFYWRGTCKDGLVCESCRALWAIKGEAIEPLKGDENARDHDAQGQRVQ